MRTLGYWLGGLYEFLRRAPWKDIAGAAVLALTTGALYTFLWLVAP